MSGQVNRTAMAVLLVGFISVAGLWSGLACNTNTGTGLLGAGGTSDSGNVLLNDAIGFEGTVSGKAVETQSTRSSIQPQSAGQSVPLLIDPETTTVRVTDLAGAELTDVDGREIQDVPLNPDGSFSFEGLPVGVDFVVCIDIGSDNDCDLASGVNIPADEAGSTGELTDIRVDPLTTMIISKLRTLIEERGINPRDLPISPVAVVTRIVDAYTHLFEETGIDQEITLDDLEQVAQDELADLFDTLLPAHVRTGMEIVEGNLDSVNAADNEALALSAAKVFLRAGFPVADTPGGLDLSPLGELNDVSRLSLDELFAQFDGPGDFPEGPDGSGEFGGGPEGGFDGPPREPGTDGPFDGDFADTFTDDLIDDLVFNPDVPSVAEFDGVFNDIVYVSDTVEPDRNSATPGPSGGDGEDILPPAPILNDHILMQMAQFQAEGRKITLNDLHDLVTSLDDGLGARLTYFLENPEFFGPPLQVFETADGKGKAIRMERLFARLFEQGFDDVDAAQFDRREGELRRLLNELLGDTVPPRFGRLFDAIASGRIAGAEALAESIRNRRAHLPFNNTGSSTFFVVADGDPFDPNGSASAVTVDADVTPDGEVVSVRYNESGTGQFLLGFTRGTEDRGMVELLVRETGRFLHGRRGPVRVSMKNQELFAPVNGQPFADMVSKSGIFYPTTNISVISGRFEPEHNFTGREAPGGPHEQILVLAEEPNGAPVRVNYDPGTGIATFDPAGRNLLMFLPDSQETGQFALFNEQTGRPAGQEDPMDFFQRPPDAPVDFEDRFNEGEFNFGDETLDMFPPDGEFFDPNDPNAPFPPDGEFFDPNDPNAPPPDGEFIDPNDPNAPPPDGEFFDPNDPNAPPPDGGFIDPNDPNAPPPPPDGNDGGAGPAQVDGVDDNLLPGPNDGTVDDGTVDGGPPIDDGFIDDGFIDDGFGDGGLVDGGPIDEGFVDEGRAPVFDDGFDGFREPNFILINAASIVGIDLQPERFTFVFGIEVPNSRYNPDNDPYFDDINGNGVQDADEPTAPFRPTLFEARDWRSTDIRLYYRRADNNGSVTFEEVAFESDTPQTVDGVELVPRRYLPRLNAFRFGRPNTAINLLTAFLPPEFFDGRHALDGETKLDIFSALAVINLVFDQVFNVEAELDVDGAGPLPPRRMLVDAEVFVVPIGDPFQLLLDGFASRSTPAP